MLLTFQHEIQNIDWNYGPWGLWQKIKLTSYNSMKKEINFSTFGCKAAAAVICVWVRVLTNFEMLIMLNLKEICQ
jgi:hypothetical protein